MLPSEVCHQTSVQACHECDDLACGDNNVRFPQRIRIDVYNAIEAVNYSTAKYSLKSPLAYRHVVDNGTKTTGPMTLGSACHVGVLEPERFERDVVIWNEPTKKGDKVAPRNGGAWEHFKRLNAGKIILLQDEHDGVCSMRDAVRSDPVAAPFLERGEAEVAMVWTDPETGLLCKGRVDWITSGLFDGDRFVSDPNGEPVIVGLKTAAEAGARMFAKQAARLYYHLQWAMYQEGYRVLTGRTPHMVEIAVESEPPHDTVAYEIGLDVTGPGLVLYHEALETIARCRKQGSWPGQSGGKIVQLVLPSYAAGIPDDVALDMTGLEVGGLEG